MVKPALMDTELTDLMNEVKSSGVMLDRSTMAGRRTYNSLKQSIGKLIKESPSAYFTLRSQLGALCYDVDEVRAAAAGLIALSSFNDYSLVNTVRSLMVVGQYGEAWSLFSHYSERMSRSEIPSEVMLLATFGFFAEWLVGFQEDVARMRLTVDKQLLERIDSICAASVVDVPESDVREMLGFAVRAFAKSKKHLLYTEVFVVDDGLLFELFGRVASEEAADIEWEYASMLAKDFPDAPTDRVSISICSFTDSDFVDGSDSPVARPARLS